MLAIVCQHCKARIEVLMSPTGPRLANHTRPKSKAVCDGSAMRLTKKFTPAEAKKIRRA